MGYRKFEMHDYRQIIYQLRSNETERSIARSNLAGRHTVRKVKQIALEQGWLNSDSGLPTDGELAYFFELSRSPGTPSKLNAHKSLIEKWIEQGIQATTIYQHLQKSYGFTGSYNCVQRYVKQYKQAHPQLTVPLHFKPGEAAQVDFGKGPDLYDKRTGKIEKTWFFVMTLCWSRHQYVEIVTHQDCETWLSCHQNAFNWFGGVSRKIIIDNPKCAITKACYHDPSVQRSYYELAEQYGFIISACPPRDPKKKGRVESGVKYVKKNFFPLQHIRSVQDANQEVKQWILSIAGNRIHGSTFEKPLTRFTEVEQCALKELPATQPEISVWHAVRLYKNCHIRYKQSFYSAPHELYNSTLWAKITTATVSIYHNHEMVAIHARSFNPGEYKSNPNHLPEKAQAFFIQTPEWCSENSLKIGKNTNFVVESFLTDPVVDLLRAAQGIIKLSKEYGNTRLELACKRAIRFNAINYTTIKEILKSGLDYQQLGDSDAFDQLGKAYQGMGAYQRHRGHINH